MTHEFKEIIQSYQIAKQKGIPAVMATVVDVEGSSYRRPGVGMLILKNGKTVGAVSGGCVEKEVLRQSQSVFDTHVPKVMTYDGKYRLGCEGLLYILIEPFEIDNNGLRSIEQHLFSRIPFQISSIFSKEITQGSFMRSFLTFHNGEKFSFYQSSEELVSILREDEYESFEREMLPCFRLVIIGAEHDAEALCALANATGWEVEVICSPNAPKELSDFLGATKVQALAPDSLEIAHPDLQTAIVLMTHNFAKDLLYLQQLKDLRVAYIGLLGPARRREKLLSALIEYFPDLDDEFMEIIHGPVGLNLGAETPQEIAISIIAEILSVIRNQKPIPLQAKKGAIHDDPKRKKLDAI